MAKVTIARQFRGPPNSGNGGYVCGVLSKAIDGPATSVLRAPVPLDLRMDIRLEEGVYQMTAEADGALIGTGVSSDGAILPRPPEAPSMRAARAAGLKSPSLSERIHPPCFTCSAERAEGDGLRVFVGQIEGAPAGHVAGIWTPNMAFSDPQGLATVETIWAALDCPGVFAWIAKAGRHGALLGTMSCEILRRPRCAEEAIIMAWPLERQGRKETAGVALFAMNGELLARAHQVWIVMGPRPDLATAQRDTVSA